MPDAFCWWHSTHSSHPLKAAASRSLIFRSCSWLWRWLRLSRLCLPAHMYLQAPFSMERSESLELYRHCNPTRKHMFSGQLFSRAFNIGPLLNLTNALNSVKVDRLYPSNVLAWWECDGLSCHCFYLVCLAFGQCPWAVCRQSNVESGWNGVSRNSLVSVLTLLFWVEKPES